MNKNSIRYALTALVMCMGAFLMPVTAYAQGDGDIAPPLVSAELFGDTPHIETGDEDSGVDAEQNPFTSARQASVLDNAVDGDGKEFYTFITPEENVFYIVIDNQRDSENVYFLNAVSGGVCSFPIQADRAFLHTGQDVFTIPASHLSVQVHIIISGTAFSLSFPLFSPFSARAIMCSHSSSTD